MFFQDPFRRIRYTMIGDDSAPTYFTVNEGNGELRLKASVNDDKETAYKVWLSMMKSHIAAKLGNLKQI